MNVFISHSSNDKAIARRVAELLRSRGLTVWIDEGQLGPGDSLSAVLANAISNIDMFVFVVTENSVNSRWVRYELNIAISRMVESGIMIAPLLFDDSALPESLRGMIWGDCRSDEGLIRSINHILKTAGVAYPMDAGAIEQRFKNREPVNFGIRLVPTQDINKRNSLGSKERAYVCLGDYAEQCGRSLRQVLSNLWFGDAFDRVFNANLEWMAIIFEIGQVNWRKLDVMPATWKAVFRILSDKRRLGLIKASSEEVARMGMPPRDYYEGNQNYWYGQITSNERRSEGIGPSKLYPDDVLRSLFGIDWLCFRGGGITYNAGLHESTISSRIFLCKNTPLNLLNHRILYLGQVNDGQVVI